MTQARRMSWAGMLVVCAVCAGAGEAGYSIALHRNLKVGGEYDIEITVEQTQTVTAKTAAGAKPATESEKYVLAARMKVAEVNAIGNSRRLTLTIGKLTNGEGKELARSGMVVDVQRGEKETTCTAMGGATLESDAAAALRMMFFAYAEPDLSDDDIYGSKTPRKIGESWPMNADVLRKGWTGMGWKIDAGAMTGQTKLESAETVRDTPMLHVSSTTDLKNATPPGIPPEIRVVSSEFHTRLEASVPVDTMGEMYIKDMSQDAVLHLQDTATGSESDVTMHAAQKESIFPTKP